MFGLTVSELPVKVQVSESHGRFVYVQSITQGRNSHKWEIHFLEASKQGSARGRSLFGSNILEENILTDQASFQQALKYSSLSCSSIGCKWILLYMSLWWHLISKQPQNLQIKQFLNNLAAITHIMYILCVHIYMCTYYVCVTEINSQNSIWSYRWHRPWIFLFILFYLTFSHSNSINRHYDHNKLRSALWKILWNKTESKTKYFHWKNNFLQTVILTKKTSLDVSSITVFTGNNSLTPPLTLQQQKQEVATQIAASLPKNKRKNERVSPLICNNLQI